MPRGFDQQKSVTDDATDIVDHGSSSLRIPQPAAEEICEFIDTSEESPDVLELAADAFQEVGESPVFLEGTEPENPQRAISRERPPYEPRFVSKVGILSGTRKLLGLWFWRSLWLVQCLYGIAALIFALAVVAAIPIVNLLALGYLLEVEGRVARSGKLSDAFPLVSTVAPRLGSIALGITLWLLPIQFLAGFAADAQLIDPGSFRERALHVLTGIVAVGIGVHLCLALARGGSLTCFIRPIKNLRWLIGEFWKGGYWQRAEQAIGQFVDQFQLRHHFSLGFRGYIGALTWLVLPTALFAIARKTAGGPVVVTIFGGFLLTMVLMWVPFLQAHFAAENRLGAMFDLGFVRRLYARSPLLWVLSVVLTLALSLPMYLFKIVLPPADAMWLVTLVFIVSIYPAKVLTGWAYHRALNRPRRSVFFWRWTCWLLLWPAVGFYVFVLYFTQFIGESGKRVLFEHHAFLLPAPFFLPTSL